MLKLNRVTAVMAAVHLAAAICLVWLLTHYSAAPLLSGSALLWVALSLIANYSPIRIYAAGTPNTVSAGFCVDGAIIALFNPLAGAVLVALGTFDRRDLRRDRRLALTLFNRSQLFVCAALSSILIRMLLPEQPHLAPNGPFMAGMAIMTLAYFVLNTTFTRAIVAALDQEPFWQRYPFTGDLLIGYLLQGLVAVVLAMLARQSEALAVLIVGPLWGVRFSLEKIVELRELNEQLVQSFADALDMRDRETAGHTRRVATLARLIGRRLGLSRRQLDDIYAAGSLHDLGKIGIPDAILLKPGKLERDEWDEMKKHPVMGASLLAPYRHLHQVTAIMRHHHERFDGGGYPDGLSGDAIPLGARIIAVADTFMVITDGRQYRAALSVEDAIEEIQRCSGSQFDPRLVAAFLDLQPAQALNVINSIDPLDRRPVLEALAPHPIWARILRFKAA